MSDTRVQDADQRIRKWVGFACKIVAGLVAGIVAISWVMGLVGPKLNLYKAETEKKAVIAEQRAKSEAAEFAAKSEVTQAQAKADAEVIRAKGLAEAQEIIDGTLTDRYLRYLYIEAIRTGADQIIYVPTEAGLPITESGRATEEGGGR